MARLEQNGLAALLRQRSELSPGEAVTALVPLLGAVGSLHSLGYTHGAISALNVLFDDRGAPVLIGFGAASVVEIPADAGRAEQHMPPVDTSLPPAILDADPGVQRDLSDLAVLVESVLSRVTEPTGVLALREWVRAEQKRAGSDFTAQLTGRLFQLGDAEPIRFVSETPDVPRTFPHASSVAVGALGRSALGRSALSPSALGPPALASPQQAWSGEQFGVGQVSTARDALVSLWGVVRAGLTRVRRRVWVIACCGLAAILVTVALSIADGEVDGTGVALTDDRQTLGETDSNTTVDSGEWGLGSEDSAITGDDPVRALPRLLTQRERCISDLSLLCLERVHQATGAAFSADASYIRALRDGVDAPPESALLGSADLNQIRLMERLGDSALLSVGADAGSAPGEATASVLLIKTEAGWRIRSLSEAP